MPTFEEKLKRLEQLTADIKRNNISLEDALNDFEEGIKLARGMEKAIYEIKNNGKKCIGEIKSITATENDKSNFYGWKMPKEIKGRITFEN